MAPHSLTFRFGFLGALQHFFSTSPCQSVEVPPIRVPAPVVQPLQSSIYASGFWEDSLFFAHLFTWTLRRSHRYLWSLLCSLPSCLRSPPSLLAWLARRAHDKPETQVPAPVPRRVRAAVRRPTTRGPAAPTAATVSPVRAGGCARRIARRR